MTWRSRFSNFRDAAGVRVAGDLELLTQTQDTSTPIERQRLQLGAGEPVLRTTRLRRYQGHLYMHETWSWPSAGFRGSTRRMREPSGSPAWPSATASIWPRHPNALTLEAATPEAAKRLGVEPRSQLMKLDRVIYAAAGPPVEWRVAYCSLKEDMVYLAEIT